MAFIVRRLNLIVFSGQRGRSSRLCATRNCIAFPFQHNPLVFNLTRCGVISKTIPAKELDWSRCSAQSQSAAEVLGDGQISSTKCIELNAMTAPNLYCIFGVVKKKAKGNTVDCRSHLLIHVVANNLERPWVFIRTSVWKLVCVSSKHQTIERELY